MDSRTTRNIKAVRAQMLAQARSASKQLQMSANSVETALTKGDMSAAGYYAASLRPQSDKLLDLLLEMRVMSDTLATIEADGT